MKKIFILFILSHVNLLNAQTNLEFFINAAFNNNPQLKEYSQTFTQSKLERELINAENNLPKISLTANYLFAPYFNNNGKLITVDPNPEAIGYDIGITNGGLYSALINVEKNIFNGYLTDALEKQVAIKDNAAQNNIALLKHEIEKQVTDQYLQTYLSSKLSLLEAQVLTYLNTEESVAKKLMENGLLKESDYLLLKIEIDNQSNTLNNSDAQFKTNLNQLLTICGVKDVAVTKLDSISLNISAISRRTSYFKKYELDSLVLMNQQEIYESKYQPQISLFFNTGLNAVEWDGIKRKFGISAGVNFSFPLYDGNQKSIMRQQSELTVKTISFYKDYFYVQMKNQQNSSLAKINSLKINLENYERQIKSYEKIIGITEKELINGMLSMVDYLTILKNFIDLKKNFVTTQNDYQMEINNYNYWNW